jgi:hypothetical protein
MKITVQRSGGYAGLTENIATLDTGQLDAEAGKKIATKVDSIGFFGYPAEISGESVGADMFRFEITVTDGAKHHSVAFTEDAPEASALLDLIQTVKATSS